MFRDRQEAGKFLASYLLKRNFQRPIIFALPRGGVPVAREVAKAFNTKLNVVIARKIGSPQDREFGIGAVSEDGVPYFSSYAKNHLDLESKIVKEIIIEEMSELKRRITLYRGGHKLKNLTNRTVILIDDGLATGVSATAAGLFLRSLNPHLLILAVPVGVEMKHSHITKYFDEIICLEFPENFTSIGEHYENFEQIEDYEVLEILEESSKL